MESLDYRREIDEAIRAGQQARSDLQQFRRELADIETIADFHVETGGFLAFADYFFDSFLVDLMVQSKIRDAQKQVEDAIAKVENVLQQLESL